VPKLSTILGYAVAVLSVGSALAAGLALDAYLKTETHVSLYLCTILFVAWFGGIGPGLFAAALAILVYEFYDLEPAGSFDLELKETLKLALFAIAVVFVVLLTGAQKSTAESLRRSETNLDEAQRLSHTGSFSWPVANGDVRWSDETYQILEVDRSAKPSVETMLQRVHPDDRELVRGEFDRLCADGRQCDFEHRLLTPSGALKYIHVRAQRLKQDSRTEEIVGALMDVTQARKAQEALDKAQTELAHVTRVTTLGEMSASIAHEVNQPLAAIVINGDASLQWLTRDVPDIDEAVEAVKRMVADADRANLIVRRIRELCKKSDPEMVRLDINHVIDEAVTLVRREALKHRATLLVELASDLPLVRGDRIQLQQVVINLVNNGVEAMAKITDRPRQVFVRTRPHDEDQVLVAVQDAGVGITPEEADRLFTAFYTTKPGGLGMGLSICRSIIQAHGGKVWAVPNDGPGMTFHFTVAADGQAANPANTGRGKLI
jgi:C4-dicarboxylate-specific signal transduction histidine kinase